MSMRHAVSQLLVAVWSGALICFMALVTPALFQAYAPDEAAKSVRLMLPRLDLLSIVLVALALGLSFKASKVRSALLGTALLLALLSALWLTPAMAELRQQAGDKMSQVPKDNPLRQQFGRLHGVSSAGMALELLLGLAALTLGRRGPSPDAA